MVSLRFIWYIVAICIIVLFCSYLGCNDNPSVNEADRTKLNEEYEEALELLRQIESEISGINQGDIPESYFQPPPPPAGGIESMLEGVTEEPIGYARILEYMLKYYPLAALEEDVVNQLDDQKRAEYKRQNDALDKDLFGSGYTLVKKVESHLRVPITVLNILRKE